MGANERKQFRIPLFCFVTMLFWFSMYTYVPILSAYVESLGANHRLAGIIVGSYGFVQMLLRIPVGIISDRIHKRRLFISFGLFFAFFSGIGLWLTKNLTLILFFRASAGAAAATWVDFTILFASYYRHEESTKAIGTISFFNTMGQMLAMFIGGLIAENISWQAPFALGTAVAILGLVLSLFIVDKFDENAQKISLEGILSVIKDRTLIVVSLLAILSQLLTFATVFGFTPLFAASLGANKFQMSLLTVFSSLPSAIASLVGGGKLSEKYGEKRIIIFGMLLVGIFTISIPFTHSFSGLILTQAIAGFGRGFSFTILMALSIKHMPSEKRATAMGFFQAIYGLGMFLGPFIMGFIGDMLSLREGFVILGFIGVFTAVLTQILIKDKK